MVSIPTPTDSIDADSILFECHGALLILDALIQKLFGHRQTGASGGVDHRSCSAIAYFSIGANRAVHRGAFLGLRARIVQRNRLVAGTPRVMGALDAAAYSITASSVRQKYGALLMLFANGLHRLGLFQAALSIGRPNILLLALALTVRRVADRISDRAILRKLARVRYEHARVSGVQSSCLRQGAVLNSCSGAALAVPILAGCILDRAPFDTRL